MIIKCLNVGSYQVNTYIIACPRTLKGAIIDPGGEDDRIKKFISDRRIKPQYIINTHGHPDHIYSNTSLSDFYQVPVCMHEADINFFLHPEHKTTSATMEKQLHHGDIIRIGDLCITVIHTPGHTPGSICLHVDDCLFSGDTLFVGDAGRTDLPGGDLTTLIHSIKTCLLPLPDDTVLYPGHDYGPDPVSTMGREKKENIYITDFILTDDN